jgi:hypothetical protein
MRRRNRSEQQQYNYYDSNTNLGARVLRRLSFDKGEEYVAAGIAVCVRDATGKIIAYQKLEERRIENPDTAMVPSFTSMTVLSRAEVDAIAGSKFKGGENEQGVYGPPGRSRTIGMKEEERMLRMKRGLPAEDLVERAQAKLQAWSHLGCELRMKKLA